MAESNEAERRSGATEARLEELGIVLPRVSPAVANYRPSVRCGELLFVSGQLAPGARRGFASGRVGERYSVTEVRELAREAGLNMIAVVQHELGSLDLVVRVVKIGGFVNSDPAFEEHPTVIDGCSDLMVQVFGDRGRHARFAVGVPSLPFGAPVEVEGLFRVESSETGSRR